MMATRRAENAFSAVVALVQRHTQCDESTARALLEAVGDCIAREVLIRRRRVNWPRLGTFQDTTHKSVQVHLIALKRLGYMPASAPDTTTASARRRLRFRPARITALLSTTTEE